MLRPVLVPVAGLAVAALLAAGCAPTDDPVAPVAATAPVAAPAEDPATAADPARPAGCVDAATVPLRAALAQTVMVGVSSPSKKQLRGLLAAPTVGGLFLHGDGTKLLTDGRMRLVARTSPAPLVSTDDEGGRVQRLRALSGNMPSARAQARTLSPRQVRDLARERGEDLRRYGITMDLAPTVDLGGRSGGVIGDRAYAKDPRRVTRYARAFAAGLRDAGVLPTLKHFPGHGRAQGDSHRGRASTPPVAELREQDWAPYRALGGADTAVMVGHLTVPGWSTPGLPSSLDPKVYRALRTELGVTGLVLTDELAGMRAVRDRFGLAEAIRRAIGAGADMALFLAPPERVRPLLRTLLADVRSGRLPEARVRDAAARVLAAKGCG